MKLNKMGEKTKLLEGVISGEKFTAIKDFGEGAELKEGALKVKKSAVVVSVSDNADGSNALEEISKGEDLKGLCIRTGNTVYLATKKSRHLTESFLGTMMCGLWGRVAIGGTIPINENSHVVHDIDIYNSYEEAPAWLKRVADADLHIQKIGKRFPRFDEGSKEEQLELFAKYYKSIEQQDSGKLKELRVADSAKIACKYIMSPEVDYDEALAFYKEKKANNLEELCYEWHKGRRGTFLHEVLAMWLINNHSIYLASPEDSSRDDLYIYVEEGPCAGTYQTNKELYFDSLMVRYLPHLNDRQMNQVYSHLRKMAPRRTITEADRRKVCCLSGLVDVDTLEVTPYTPEYFLTKKVPLKFNPEAKSEKILSFMKKFTEGDKTTVELLFSIGGYMLYPRNYIRRSILFIISQKGHGKSTLLKLYKALTENRDITIVEPSRISADGFATRELKGKSLWLCDDIDTGRSGYVEDVSVIKKVATGEYINARNPYTQSGGGYESFLPQCKIVLAANEGVRMRDPGGALMDRMIVIHANHNFKDDSDCDPLFETHLSEEDFEAFFALCLSSLKKVLETHEMPIPAQADAMGRALLEAADPLTAFLEDQGIHRASDLHGKGTGSLYNDYKEYCVDVLGQEESNVTHRNTFINAIKTQYGVGVSRNPKTIDGERMRVFEPM